VILIFSLLLLFQCPAHAKSRTVHLSEGGMETVYLEHGYSTILKFTSHPEKGLIGDQDGFKVEYLRDMVAIKPLVTRGKTNLFLFTKEGQFNFQLISGPGRHDNVVYVRGKANPVRLRAPPEGKISVPVDELLVKTIKKSTATDGAKLTLESIATPSSRAAMVLRISIEEKIPRIPYGSRQSSSKAETGAGLNKEQFSISQGKRLLTIENLAIETRHLTPEVRVTAGFILIRCHRLQKGEALRLVYRPKAAEQARREVVLSFVP
jgi:hypothetical protein